MTKEYSSYLAHHGVKGQKWGVRRYQNEDGTLTEEGKAKYNAMSDRDKKVYDQYNEIIKGIDATNKQFKKKLENGDLPWYQSRAMLKKAVAKNDKDIEELRQLAGETIANAKTVSLSEIKKSKMNLTDRFNKASQDNPKLTYNQIYKEMKVDMESDDPDIYKEAEDRWLRKHGY